jgi:hypothetical protein
MLPSRQLPAYNKSRRGIKSKSQKLLFTRREYRTVSVIDPTVQVSIRLERCDRGPGGIQALRSSDGVFQRRDFGVVRFDAGSRWSANRLSWTL